MTVKRTSGNWGGGGLFQTGWRRQTGRQGPAPKQQTEGRTRLTEPTEHDGAEGPQGPEPLRVTLALPMAAERPDVPALVNQLCAVCGQTLLSTHCTFQKTRG